MAISSIAAPTTLLVLLFISASSIYAPGERCLGAPGYAAVQRHNPPCGDGAACDVPDPEYGFRCPEAGCGGGEGCYKTGERAQYTYGKPAVPWRPCDGIGQGPFPDEGFVEFAHIKPGEAASGSSKMGDASSGGVFLLDYTVKVNEGGVVSLAGADKVITSVECFQGGEVRLKINPLFDTKTTLQEMFPGGAVLSIDGEVYGECILGGIQENEGSGTADDGVVNAPISSGGPQSGFLYIESVSGSVHDAVVFGRPASYLDIFQEADLFYRRDENVRLSAATVIRQSEDSIFNRALEVEYFSVIKVELELNVENKGDVDVLRAKWSLATGEIDFECKLVVEYEAVADIKVKVSSGVQLREALPIPLNEKLSFPLYGVRTIALPDIGDVKLGAISIGLLFETPIVFALDLQVEKELGVPITATINSGRKEVVLFARGNMYDGDSLQTGADFPVNNPVTTAVDRPLVNEAILGFSQTPLEVNGSFYIGIRPTIALRIADLIWAKVFVDYGFMLDANTRLVSPVFPPQDEGTIGVCDTCHKAELEGAMVLEGPKLAAGFKFVLPLPKPLNFSVTKKIEKGFPDSPSISNKLFTACLFKEFGEETELCQSGPSALCCDASVSGQSCQVLSGGEPSCAASPEPTDIPEEEEVTAGMFTDPHLRTFDQLAFDCQASGEFILAKSASSGLMIQGRFSGQDSSGSVLTGIALQDTDSSRLEVSVIANTSATATADCALRLLVDGSLKPFESASLGNNGSAVISVSSRMVTLSTGAGVSVSFSKRRSSTFGCYLESFSVSIPVSIASDISGLLGTPNGDKTDDWQTRNGTVLPLPEDRSGRLFRAAYMYCTQNWCIRDVAESIFSYVDGQSHGGFYFCDRPYTELDISSASPELVTLCGESFECIVDGLVGGLEDAAAGRDALVELEARFNTTLDPVVTLPSDLSGLVLQAKFSWESKGDLDTSASWFGTSVGFGCEKGETEFLAWSNDNVSATGFEHYEIDLEGYLQANSWNGSIEVRFGAGWYSLGTSLGPAALRMSLLNQTSGEDVPGTVLETDVNPGVQRGCADENVVAIAKLSEGSGGAGVRLEVERPAA